MLAVLDPRDSQLAYASQAIARTVVRVLRGVRGETYSISGRAGGKWFFSATLPANRPVLWIDVLSGGEATQTVSLCQQLKKLEPELFLLVTTNNAYAADYVRGNNPYVDLLWDSPWDLAGIASGFLNKIRPRALVFLENCSLPVLAQSARRRGVPTLLVSGLVQERFENHPIYQRPFRKKFHQSVDQFLVKEPEDAATLHGWGVPADRVSITGNLKYDPALARGKDTDNNRLRTQLGLSPSDRVFIGGSLHPGEAEIALECFRRMRQSDPAWKLILVPRYPEKAAAAQGLSQAAGFSTALWSDPASARGDWSVLVVDVFGKLSQLYSISALCLLGGSFYKRHRTGFSQNLVEPVLAGVPTFFGPFTAQFEALAGRLCNAYPGFRCDSGSAVSQVLGYASQTGAKAAFQAAVEALERDCRGTVEVTARAIVDSVRGKSA